MILRYGSLKKKPRIFRQITTFTFEELDTLSTGARIGERTAFRAKGKPESPWNAAINLADFKQFLHHPISARFESGKPVNCAPVR